jgi:hypothetical protein
VGPGHLVSANDVLHAGMMVWIVVLVREVAPRLRDARRAAP